MVMTILRDKYIEQLVSKSWNGRVKIITGLRRCGKSFLLNTLFRNHLLGSGVAEDEIISIDLEKKSDAKFRNPIILLDHVLSRTGDMGKKYYVFIDEIQMSLKVRDPELEGIDVAEEDKELLYFSRFAHEHA